MWAVILSCFLNKNKTGPIWRLCQQKLNIIKILSNQIIVLLVHSHKFQPLLFHKTEK
jgi:hypothetical protein